MTMKEYSVRFLIAMIIGVFVLLLFIAGKSEQLSFEELNRLEIGKEN